jgi:transcriptional regulator with XRE-family HTH domain
MKGRLVRRASVQDLGKKLWLHIGSRLRSRRTRRGLTMNGVAQELGIELRVYEAYEAGAEQPPAHVLTQIAELFEVPVFWFFQDVAFEAAAIQSSPKGTYRVATLEERMHFLTDSFRKLDLEGQQHLLAIAGALAQSSAS